MSRESYERWLEAYKGAWEGRSPARAVELFTEEATYQVTPFHEPMRGREAIHAYWSRATDSQRNVRFEYKILAVTEEYGVNHWRVTLEDASSGAERIYDGIFHFSLDGEGRCTTFREWWHSNQRET